MSANVVLWLCLLSPSSVLKIRVYQAIYDIVKSLSLQLKTILQCFSVYFLSLEVREKGYAGPLLVKLCGGDEVPANITSTTGSLYLTLSANSSTTSTGFHAIFYKLEDSCVHVISSGGGTITSPGYPVSYASYLDCAWYIDVLDGVAKVNFEEIDMEIKLDLPDSRECLADELEVILSFNCY